MVTIDCGGAVIASWTVKESTYGHVRSNPAILLSRTPVFLKKRRNMNDERCNAFGQTHGQAVSSTHNLRTTHAQLKFYSNGRPGKVVGMVTSDRECSAHDLRERLWPCNTPHMSEDDSTRVYRTVSCVQNSATLRRIERAGWCRFTVFHL